MCVAPSHTRTSVCVKCSDLPVRGGGAVAEQISPVGLSTLVWDFAQGAVGAGMDEKGVWSVH